MEQKMEVAQGFYTGQTRGGRTCLDGANQHPTCPQAPVSSHLTLCTSRTPSTPVFLWSPPRAWALMAVACRCLVRAQQPCKLHFYHGCHRGSPSWVLDVTCLDQTWTGSTTDPLGSILSYVLPAHHHSMSPVRAYPPRRLSVSPASTSMPWLDVLARMLPAERSCHLHFEGERQYMRSLYGCVCAAPSRPELLACPLLVLFEITMFGVLFIALVARHTGHGLVGSHSISAPDVPGFPHRIVSGFGILRSPSVSLCQLLCGMPCICV